MRSPIRFAGLMLCLVLSSAGFAQDVAPDASAIWQKVRADLFAGMPISSDDGVIALDTPKRAEDAAVVPLAVRARLPQSEKSYVEKLWLIVDNNPSPIAAVF